MYRKKMGRSSSKRLFSKTASKQHRRNFGPHPMRGGIRL